MYTIIRNKVSMNLLQEACRIIQYNNKLRDGAMSIIRRSLTSKSLEFTKEQNNKILEVINSKTATELNSFDISKNRTEKIYAWRIKNGHFENLEQILQISGFGTKILEKFAYSILNDPGNDVSNNAKVSNPKTKSKPKHQYTIPPISDHIQNNCNSCLSLHVGVSNVAWCRLELNKSEPCTLTNWDYIDIIDKKLHMNDLVQRCLYLSYQIPSADCYVLDNPQVAQPSQPGNANQININLQKSQLMALMSYALASRLKVDNIDNLQDTSKKHTPNVYFLKKFVSAKLFNTLVGNERVSTEKIILELLRTHYNIEDMPDNVEEDSDNTIDVRGSVSVGMKLREYYSKSERYQKEFLGQSLLMGLTFIRLAILQCPNSIDKVTPSSRIL